MEKLAQKASTGIPGEGDTRANRLSGLGPLLGLATGVGIGAAYGAVTELTGRPHPFAGAAAVGAAAMAGTSAPMALLGVSDPREWGAEAWLADAIPHLAYGAVTGLTYDAMHDR